MNWIERKKEMTRIVFTFFIKQTKVTLLFNQARKAPTHCTIHLSTMILTILKHQNLKIKFSMKKIEAYVFMYVLNAHWNSIKRRQRASTNLLRTLFCSHSSLACSCCSQLFINVLNVYKCMFQLSVWYAMVTKKGENMSTNVLFNC